MAALFSREFFSLAKLKLKPGGMMVQWVHGYSLLPGDLKMLVKTFQAAFRATTVWNTTLGDYLLLGSERPVPVDLARLKTRYTAMRGLRDDLSRIGFRSGVAFLADFMLGEEDVARYASDASLNTDDRS